MHDALRVVCRSENLVVDRDGFAAVQEAGLCEGRLVLLVDDEDAKGAADLIEGLSNAEICIDYTLLVDEFRSSPDELRVVGGSRLLRMFLHHADQLDVVETDEPTSDSGTFNEWTRAGFVFETTDSWEVGRRLQGKRPENRDGIRRQAAMALYDMTFNWNRPDKAAELFLGSTYRQHNPHVADGGPDAGG